MKFVILFNILLIIGAVLAKSEMDESVEETTTIMTNDDDSKEMEKADDNTKISDNKNEKPVNFFYGQQSHSVFNSNGNGIVVSSRFDSNGREEKYISIGSPKIRIDGEYFSCTSLSCPEDAFKCVVTSEAIADDSQNMKTKAECIDKDGKVLKDAEFVEPNIHPDAQPPFSRVATVDRNGGIDIEDSTGRNSFNVKKLSKEEEEELNRNLQEQNHRMAEMFALQQRLFQQQMEELNRHLTETFSSPNFPFGNYNPFRQPNYGFNSFPSFVNNWPFGGSSFGIRNSFPPTDPFRESNPFVNSNPFRDNVNFDTIEIDRPTNTFYVETSNPTNSDSHSLNPYSPIPQRPKESEFIGSNESDNEIFGDTTNRIMVNNNRNRFNEKYRYAHNY